uniref:Uncharacterized protein n=1 Tax=Arundo donax TaxID=35708 RepID=A0A0A9GYJ4_ARUDO
MLEMDPQSSFGMMCGMASISKMNSQGSILLQRTKIAPSKDSYRIVHKQTSTCLCLKKHSRNYRLYKQESHRYKSKNKDQTHGLTVGALTHTHPGNFIH